MGLGLARVGRPVELGPVVGPAGEVGLRPLRRSDGARWRELRLADEALIRRWDPSSRLSWAQRHTRTGWLDHFRMMRIAADRGVAVPFAITVDDVFVGQMTVAGIQRFPLHSGWLGYWVSSAVSGRGVATTAAALTVMHGFDSVSLHRIDATVAPENIASQRVLAHLGFRQEGLLKRYLDIDGGWRDHQLWALTTEEVRGGLAGLLGTGT